MRSDTTLARKQAARHARTAETGIRRRSARSFSRGPALSNEAVLSPLAREHPRRREGYFDQRAGIDRALDAEARAVRFHQRLGQRQAEAGAARVAARCRQL